MTKGNHLAFVFRLCLNVSSLHRVFHLIALKLTLTRLDLSDNPCVTDDAVPALNLCINSKLNFLGLVGTSVAMPGLRLMAKLIQREDRIVDVEIPEACESYIDGLSH